MKNKISNRLFYVFSLVIVLLSSLLTVLDFVIPFNLFIHPLLNLIFFIFIGFFVFLLVLGIIKKSPWFIFVSALLLELSLIYLLISIKALLWTYVAVLVLAPVIMALIAFIVCGNKTEDIALNKQKEYKTYHENKAEEKPLKKEEIELPKIKSFKD